MNRLIICILVLSAAFLMPVSSMAQSGEALDLKRIRHKAIRELISRENVRTTTDFQHIATSCYHPEDSAHYRTNLMTYVVRARIGKVWEKYMNLTPRKAWSGRTVNFGFLFSRLKNKFVYAENANEPIREGNIIFVNLRILQGLKNLGVGFEITRLDEVNKIICFCYLKDGISNGTQEIKFTEMANGNTRITHLTHYRSHSAFRDKELYPLFHSMFVGEFHQNVLSQFEKGS